MNRGFLGPAVVILGRISACEVWYERDLQVEKSVDRPKDQDQAYYRRYFKRRNP
jgi:hypothetical protein